MGAFLGLVEFELRATGNHIVAVFDKVMHQVQQVEQPRTAVHQDDCNAVFLYSVLSTTLGTASRLTT